MAPHRGKVCVKKILKLDVTNAALGACRIETEMVKESVKASRTVAIAYQVSVKSLGMTFDLKV